jgi:hypothetical protein
MRAAHLILLHLNTVTDALRFTLYGVRELTIDCVRVTIGDV